MTDGERFGRLTLTGGVIRRKGVKFWLCRCDCGAEKEVRETNLKLGRASSCGCLQKELAGKRMASTTPARKHGHAKGKGSRAYHSWARMIDRCENRRNKNYADYGGRGINVCERWRKSFADFLADMGEPPSRATIDRHPDNDGNYEPGNCRWASRKQQASNRRSNRLLTHAGKTQTLAAWAEELGIAYFTLHRRLRRGWSVERTLSQP